jgi:NhaP-type Na+/H+ or K+/H+ antiporter
VYAAILLTGTGTGNGEVSSWIVQWLAWDLVGKVLIGVALGIVVGRAFAWLAFRKWPGLAESNEGILALSATFASYGLVEAAHGWGFVGVFVTGLTIRGHESESRYHADLHEFSHQIERSLTMVALLMFGVACGSGLLAPLTWQALLLAVLLVVVIRPALGMLALLGCEGSWGERAAKAFFGVRGIAAFYYLAYGIGHAPFGDQELLWATASAAVLCSIVVHGVTAAPVLQRLDAWRRRASAEARGT